MNFFELIKNDTSIISGAIGGIIASVVCWFLIGIGKSIKGVIILIYNKNKTKFKSCKRKIKICFIELKYISYWFGIMTGKLKERDAKRRPIQLIRVYKSDKYITGVLLEGIKVISINNKPCYKSRRLTAREFKSWNRYFNKRGERTLEQQVEDQIQKDRETISELRNTMQLSVSRAQELINLIKIE